MTAQMALAMTEICDRFGWREGRKLAEGDTRVPYHSSEGDA